MNKDKHKVLPDDDDHVVFVPDEDRRSIERAIRAVEQAKRDLQKMGADEKARDAEKPKNQINHSN